MLSRSVAKGGSSLKIRYGNQTTRFTRDLDTARIQSLDDFVQELEDALAAGWGRLHGKSRPQNTRRSRKRASPLRHETLRGEAQLQRKALEHGAPRGRTQRNRRRRRGRLLYCTEYRRNVQTSRTARS
ncbi:nucleotidyl transferase AbiEii/AbiGii toxin family protein [Eggerthella sinensis]|uniref:nucleotidyl transferase AbiEii/AbiGii toxin family protein n=1 Tax=Eggerthella sinensis TaxID=242230 RepID=UPI003461A6FA